MKLAILLSLALCAIAQAHMGMTLHGVPAREKLALFDNYRSPQGKKICHGTKKIAVQKKVKAGDTIKGVMSGGAAHGGGHCSMLVSVDEKKWYKIGDYKDCTTQGGLTFTMPKGVPTECSAAAGCTFGWLWTPMLSGTCEIYMNCYNLEVEGAMGGIEAVENRKLDLPLATCVRPNTKTKWTTMFGPLIGSNAPDPYQPGTTAQPAATAPPADNAPVTVLPVQGSPTCKPGQLLLATGLPKVHKVAVEDCGYVSEQTDPVAKAQDEKDKCLSANSLSIISTLYDLQCAEEQGCSNWDVLYELNKCADKSMTHSCDNNIPTCMAGTPDQICVGQSLKLPQTECGESPCGVNGDWSPARQVCLCVARYSGAQCQFNVASVGSMGAMGASLAHSLMYGCLLVVGFLIHK